MTTGLESESDLQDISVLCLCLVLPFASMTVDITLPQFQYLANHLSSDECIVLIQELFKIDSDIPEDLSCLDLLLFWNSSPGEGLGETHHLVCDCLNKIEKNDLSNWLSKSVFEQLQLSHQKFIVKDDDIRTNDQDDMNEDETIDENATDSGGSVEIVALCVILVCFLMGVALCIVVLIPKIKYSRHRKLDSKFLSQNKKYTYKYKSKHVNENSSVSILKQTYNITFMEHKN